MHAAGITAGPSATATDCVLASITATVHPATGATYVSIEGTDTEVKLGFRLRKSLKIAPGVRLNVSRTGVGASIGVKGARHAVHSSGRQTTMIGNPIFGVGYVEQTGGGRTKRSGSGAAARATPPPSASSKPGLFAPKGEKELWKALQKQDTTVIARVGAEFSDYRVPANSIAGLLLAKSAPEQATGLLSSVLEADVEPAADPFIQQYVEMDIGVTIAPGVRANLPFARDAIGLVLAELRQEAGNVDGAIDVVERLEPTTYAAVSLAELYSAVGRHDDVIALTEGLANEDDVTGDCPARRRTLTATLIDG